MKKLIFLKNNRDFLSLEKEEKPPIEAFLNKERRFCNSEILS